MRQKRKKWGKVFFLFFLIIVVCCGWLLYFNYNWKLIYKNEIVEIEKWDTIAKFYKNLGWFKKTAMKLWLRNNPKKVPIIQEWRYVLDWEYTKEELMSFITKWPQREYVHVTVLEWWSKYDIDAMLTQEKLISAWDYIEKVDNLNYIETLKWDYPFLMMIPQGKSLEGFLYPDTYYLDDGWDIKDQLIKAQLKNFDKKVWSQYSSKFELENLQITPYWIVTLASIIENEEKNNDNKPIIAGIFINRLKKSMRLDADVTLCYGLWIVYNKCRENINANLNDSSNLYNTRQNYWLTPTPISSPTEETITSLLNYKKTNALYYLHDDSWKIHYADTLEWHNQNKSKYL